MILVDTSVLIDYFRGIENEKTARFRSILEDNTPFGINDFIYLELLQGCRTDKDYRLLKEYLDTQHFYNLKNGRESYARAARIFFDLRSSGQTVTSSIDCLIAQTAIENNLLLLHNDADFSRIRKVAPLKEL